MRNKQAELAIQMALQGRWPEAVQLNRSIIDAYPTDVDALNRLGKAYTELGRYGEAREAYEKAIEVDPVNSIARKNLTRLASLRQEEAPRVAMKKLSPEMFIEETGKTSITQLARPNMEVAARLTAGDEVELARSNGSLVVVCCNGQYVGEVEPRLAQRLIKLMEGGNQYVAAISGLGDRHIRLFIRESFQHPSQAGRLSFPYTTRESVRPYVKERLLRKDREEADEYYEDGEDSDDWEPAAEDEESPEVSLYQFSASRKARIPAAEDDEEENI